METNMKKEPGQSANCTSSKEKSIYNYDTTDTLICQALKVDAVAAEMGATADYKDGVFVIEPRGDQ